MRFVLVDKLTASERARLAPVSLKARPTMRQRQDFARLVREFRRLKMFGRVA